MRELIKLMIIPILGCIAIGTIFLLIVFGGKFENTVYNEDGTRGLATVDLGSVDGVLVPTGTCDSTLYQPVCGEDGKTYDNMCYATKANTKVSHNGACGPRE